MKGTRVLVRSRSMRILRVSGGFQGDRIRPSERDGNVYRL